MEQETILIKAYGMKINSIFAGLFNLPKRELLHIDVIFGYSLSDSLDNGHNPAQYNKTDQDV